MLFIVIRVFVHCVAHTPPLTAHRHPTTSARTPRTCLHRTRAASPPTTRIPPLSSHRSRPHAHPPASTAVPAHRRVCRAPACTTVRAPPRPHHTYTRRCCARPHSPPYPRAPPLYRAQSAYSA
ncbi:hypothetical protein R3P38DRAFT_3212282 [Favolaschia claudopus]|uniref:Secreted protein n=1 Tax=Favolaschia claudopus TaxID=2862362 RepID=A0AAW0AEG8_9AGAR